MNVNRLLHALELVTAYPNNLFDLDLVARQTECGTIACVVGVCSLNTQFQEWGMRHERWGIYREEIGRTVTLFDIAAEVFNISHDDAVALFCEAFRSRYDEALIRYDPERITSAGSFHKLIFTRRLEKFFAEKGIQV